MAEPKRIPDGMQVFSMVSGQARIEDEADFVIIHPDHGLIVLEDCQVRR